MVEHDSSPPLPVDLILQLVQAVAEVRDSGDLLNKRVKECISTKASLKWVKKCYLSVKAVLLLKGLGADHLEDLALLLAGLDADLHLRHRDHVVPVGVEDLEVGVGLSLNELSTEIQGNKLAFANS